MAIIKTPDQRVRVFISSTINELADERKAAREAISNLRLTPVFFEAGARPHPPRDLYSAYLDQSHIFLGIYWNSYGWVAPGADISGLEDEYRLCGNKPKLIYVKRSDERQPKLNDLLKDIENSDTACYQMFSDAEELQTLIENDLSVLMSETFENALYDQQQGQPQAEPKAKQRRMDDLPIIRGEIFGRDVDIAAVSELITKPDVSLVTLLGAGGTGKTTLSIYVADQVKDQFKDGAVFVPLAPVTDHTLVAGTIAESIDLQDSGKQPIQITLLEFLMDKNLLLVLDNFEQVIEASKLISDITLQCRDVKMIVTSRTSLHIRNERIYNLGPLAIPDLSQTSAEELQKVPSAQLFIERAMAVNPNLPLNAENIKAIIDICQRLDGLPLAIELAAARTRFFQPAALMSRISNTLDLVSKGHKDLPERQQTLRGAIEWSYNLLTEETQKVFRQLGVFKRSWTIEAADAVLNTGDEFVDIEEMTERLLDVSLIKPVLVSHSSEPRFNMLQTVHEYASEMLAKSPEGKETKTRYAEYFLQMMSETEWLLWKVTSEPWLDKIEYEFQNIRAAFYIFLEEDRKEDAWNLFYYTFTYWAMRGGYTEGLAWIKAAGIDNEELWSSDEISDIVKGRTLTWAALTNLMLLHMEEGMHMIQKAQEVLESTSDEVMLATAMCLKGCYGTFINAPQAGKTLEQGQELAERVQHPFPLCMIYLWSFDYYFQQGRLDIVEQNFMKAQQIAEEHDYIYMRVTVFTLRYLMMAYNPEVNYEQMANEAIHVFEMMPEKGYKGMKATVMGAHTYCMIKSKELEEAQKSLRKAMEYARESSEKETELHRVVEAALFAAHMGSFEKACKLLGAAEAFSESSGYPIVGTGEAQCKEVRDLAFTDVEKAQRWYDQGRGMTIEKATVYALE